MSQLCIKQGWLEKQGSVNLSNWHRRYFMIINQTLYRFNSVPSGKAQPPKGEVSLKGCKVYNRTNVRPNCIAIEDYTGREHLLVASSLQEMNDWIYAIKKASGAPTTPNPAPSHAKYTTEQTCDLTASPLKITLAGNICWSLRHFKR
eukprot:TRINITY_DN4089_c0_g1_i4.p1 TRINITY_DN4089_c0_g1~~TRINITY_DN4089_c0_g1_i4.p1  ORF type:complete len:147 (-),score=17.12 TRINITY_DN4089_c0_g1_i4:68-508(-)